MTREEYFLLLSAAKKELMSQSRLTPETKAKLVSAKEEMLRQGTLTEDEKVEVYKLLQADMKPSSSEQNGTQMRFGGRGPRNFGSGEKAKNAKGTLKRLIVYFQKEIKLVCALLFSIIVAVLAQVITPRLQSLCIDFIDDKNFTELPYILLWMMSLFILLSVFTLLQGLISAVLSQRIVKRMRKDLFHKIVRLPIVYFDTHSHGDIMSRMTNDVDNISNTLAQSLSSLFSGMMMIVGTMIMMFITSWPLALLSLAVIILTVIATKLLSKAMRKFYKKRQILLGSLNGTVEEMVTGYQTVAGFSKEEDTTAEFEATSSELTKTGIIAEILGGSMGPIMNTISNIGFVIIAAFGGYFAIQGLITVGIISAFIIYAREFSRPINEIAQLYGQLQTALASAERVFLIFDNVEEDKSGTYDMATAKGNISFQHINFSYDGSKQVLFDFSLDIKNGEKIALVGATGSGKTTVVNLLMRFYDCDSGNIFIDGVDIRDIKTEELRRNTAIVLQDTILFHDTVLNNLKYSNLKASETEIRTAAEICHCADFISQLKGEYQSVLTEGGANLSQGQRQLLSIARAFIAKPKILILDEATSSVDTRTEKQIQDAMLHLMENKTSLIIAHRLSTILDADKIVVMDNGRIVETGNHQTLLAKKGKYYELYMTQYAGNPV